MKKILLAFVFGMITLSVFPQKKVSFLDNEPWEKVLKQAQKAQKMVFVVVTLRGVFLVNI